MISVLQERQTSGGASGVTSISLAFSSSVTAGSALHAIAGHDGGVGTTYTFSDGGNTWPPGVLDHVSSAAAGATLLHQVAEAAAAGPTTITLTFDTGHSFPCLWIREIGDATLAGNPDGHNAVDTESTTSQTISATNANQPALISIVVSNQGGSPTVPTLDASLTEGPASPGWNFGGAFASTTISGSKRITTTGTQSVTNTISPASQLFAVMAIFKEASGGAQSYNYTMLGGVTLSGISVSTRTASLSARTGGLSLRGSGIQNRIIAHASSGGIAFSGISQRNIGRQFLGTGGLVFSGNPLHSRATIRNSTGGITFGGNATESSNGVHTYAYIGVGGLVFGSTAAFLRVAKFTPAGGLVFSGSAQAGYVIAGAKTSIYGRRRWYVPIRRNT